MKHIAQKITREAAKDPVNPENPRPKKNKSPRDSALSSGKLVARAHLIK